MKYFGWIQLGLGFWVFVSPWILGFAGISIVLWSNIAVGALIMISGLWILFGPKNLI